MGNGNYVCACAGLASLLALTGCVLDVEPASPLAAKPQSQSWTSQVADSASAFGNGVKKQFNKLAYTSAEEDPTMDPRLSLATKVDVNARTFVAAAQMNERRNNDAIAQQKYERALETDATYLPALLGLARLHDRHERYAEAEQYYRSATQHHPAVAASWNDLGICLARQGQYTESIQALERSVALEPNKPLFANNLAKVLLSQGQIDTAVARLQAVHGPAVAHYNAGYMLNDLGQPQLAVEQFERCLQIDPQLTAARSWHQQISTRLAQAPLQHIQIPQPPAPRADYPAQPYQFLPGHQPQPNMATGPAGIPPRF